MGNRLFSLGLACLLLLSLLIACATAPIPSVTTVPLAPSTSTATAQPSLTPAPTPTPGNPYAVLPVISPGNASNVKEIKRLSKGTVERALWTPDSKRLVVGTSNGIYIYDVATHKELEFFNSNAPAHCMTISPDGQWLAWCDGARTRIRDLAEHREYSVLEGGGAVTTVVFSPDSQTLAVERIIQRSDGEGTPGIDSIEVYRLSDRELLLTVSPGSEPVFSTDGNFLAVSVDEEIQFLNMTTRRSDFAVGASWELVFSPDGRLLASNPKDENGHDRVELRDMRTQELICQFQADSPATVAFNSDGTRLANASTPGIVEIRDANTCQLLDTISGHQGYVQIAYSPDGHTLATVGSLDRIMRLWNPATGQQIRTIGEFNGGWEGFSPDGKMILEKRWHDGNAAVWSVSEGVPIWTLEEHMPHASSVAFSPDGRLLASGHEYGQVHLWSLDTGQVQSSFGGFSFVSDVAFSPDGQLIAAGGIINSAYGEDTHIEIKLVDNPSGKRIFTWTGNNSEKTWITTIGFSPDGMYFGAASIWDNAIRVWDLNTRQIQMVFVPQASLYNHPIAFSSDSQAIAISDAEGFVRFWDVHSTRRLPYAYPFTGVGGDAGVSSGKSLLAVEGEHYSIRLWDIHTRAFYGIIENVSSNIFSVSVSPDGSVIAVSGWDSEGNGYDLNLWDIKTRQRLKTFSLGTDRITDLAFSPDGRLLASAGSDGVVRLWGVR